MAEDAPHVPDSELREYAWKYFSLHADQRIKTFNFYILLCGLAIAAITTVVKDMHGYFVAGAMCLGLAVLSLVFKKLDMRNRELIGVAEAALKELEGRIQAEAPETGAPNRLQLFRREDHETDKLRLDRGRDPRTWHMSYTECFNVVFLMFGVSTFVVGLVLLAKSAGIRGEVADPAPCGRVHAFADDPQE